MFVTQFRREGDAEKTRRRCGEDEKKTSVKLVRSEERTSVKLVRVKEKASIAVGSSPWRPRRSPYVGCVWGQYCISEGIIRVSLGGSRLSVLGVVGAVSGLAVVGVSLGESWMAKDSSETQRRVEEAVSRISAG